MMRQRSSWAGLYLRGSFRASVSDYAVFFFQTNSYGAEVVYKTARTYIGDTKARVIYDLYSGTGTIAQMLSPVAEKVIGVEIVEEAVEAAKKMQS